MKPNKSGLSKAFQFLARHYFRSKLILDKDLFEGRDSSRPVLFVANHSGMAFSWDAHILREELVQHFGNQLNLCRLVAPIFFKGRLIQHFGIEGFRPLDSVPATWPNFEHAVVAGRNILIFPEGVGGISKGFNHKYEVQNISTSTVRLALQHQVDLVFVSIINGEYLNPFAYKNSYINRLAAHLGLPFLPFGFSLVYLLAPWGLYGAMPANLKFVLSRRVRPNELSSRPFDQLTEEDIKNVTEGLRKKMQETLNQNLARYGGVRFGCQSLFREIKSLRAKAVFLFPCMWPIFFQLSALPESASRWQHFKALIRGAVQGVPLLGWLFHWFYLSRQNSWAYEGTEKSKSLFDRAG